MNHNKKKRKNENEQQQFEFCEVCRLNHNHGRRHNFFPRHKSALSNFLTRFQSKLSDVKIFLKTPMLILPEHAHQNRLYCVFCNCDILELDSQFACSNAVEHLASEEHCKKVKAFMWKYGSGMNHVDSFRITAADLAKWKKKCMSLKMDASKTQSVRPLNNIHTECHVESASSSSKKYFDSLKSCVPNYVVPLHSYTNERNPPSASEIGPSSHSISGGSQVQDDQYLKNSTGFIHSQHCSNFLASECSSYGYSNNRSDYSGVRLGNEEISPDLVNLTQNSSTTKVILEGNVHTGAPPPWFDPTKGDICPAQCPELRESVASRVGKSKLNPKRVGAAWAERRKLELEMERRGERVNNSFDCNWLPNFGRVWQSGTRKDSRKEFQMENNATPEGHHQSEELMTVQPYIRKGLRKVTEQMILSTSMSDAEACCQENNGSACTTEGVQKLNATT